MLTGRGNDGALGIRAVKRAGGMTLAQAAHDARAPEMATAAAATGCLDLVLPLRVLGSALVSWRWPLARRRCSACSAAVGQPRRLAVG